jgi:hypothetical protein
MHAKQTPVTLAPDEHHTVALVVVDKESSTKGPRVNRPKSSFARRTSGS